MNKVVKTEDEFIAALTDLSDVKLILKDLNFYSLPALNLKLERNYRTEIVSTTGGGVFGKVSATCCGQFGYLRLQGLCIDELVIGPGASVSVADCQIGILIVAQRVVVNGSTVELVDLRENSNCSVRRSAVTEYRSHQKATLSIHDCPIHVDSFPTCGAILANKCSISGESNQLVTRTLQRVGLKRKSAPANVRYLNCSFKSCLKPRQP